MISAIRSPACPSHSGGPSPTGPMPSARIASTFASHRLRLDEAIGAVGDRDRTFRVGTDREARNAEDGGLLLDPARVGDDEGRAPDQGHELDVAERVDDPHPIARRQAGGRQVGPATGVDRQDDGGPFGDRRQHRRDPRRLPGIVDVGRAVDGRDDVSVGEIHGRRARQPHRSGRGSRSACRSSGSRRDGSASGRRPRPRGW